MRHASLFSGIGGPEVAAAMLGWENVFHCEINEFGRRVLEYWFPESDSYEDITKTDFTKYRGTIDILTGGFPCQPFSYAGKRGGQQDQRYLWPEMLRVINEVRPTWVIGENVAGIGTMVEQCRISDLGSEVSLFEEGDGIHRYSAEFTFTIERICKDLESIGYSIQPMLIPACAVGAPHRRDRVFFIAYNVADSNSCYDLRGSGKHEGEGGKERLQEWNEVRKPRKSSDIRSEDFKSAENSMCNGLFSRLEEEQKCEWNIGNTSTRDSKWICGEERLDSSNTECLRLQHNLVRRSQTGMSEEESRGRERCVSEQIQFSEAIGEREFIADTDSNRGREIHQYIQSEFSNGEKSFSNGGIRNAPNTSSERLERENESRCSERRKWLHIWRNLAGCCGADDLRPEERWKTFPTVSAVHRGNDGIPFNVDSLTISFAKWRTESIKAYGNAIVPQVMYRIFEAIEAVEATR